MYWNLKYAQSLLVSLPCIVFFETNGCRSVPPPPEIPPASPSASTNEANDMYARCSLRWHKAGLFFRRLFEPLLGSFEQGTNRYRPSEIAPAFDHSSAEAKDKYSRGMRQLFTSRVTGVASGLFLGVGLYYLGREFYEPAPESKRDLLISLPMLGVGFGFFVPFIIEKIRAEHSFPEAHAAYHEDLRQRLQLPR